MPARWSPISIAIRLDADADHATLLLRIASWCERYTPLVGLGANPETEAGVGGDHGLFMDITGCAHLMGGEATLVADLEARLLAQGFHAGCAWPTRRVRPGRWRAMVRRRSFPRAAMVRRSCP
jgi:protein ImuB